MKIVNFSTHYFSKEKKVPVYYRMTVKLESSTIAEYLKYNLPFTAIIESVRNSFREYGKDVYVVEYYDFHYVADVRERELIELLATEDLCIRKDSNGYYFLENKKYDESTR